MRTSPKQTRSVNKDAGLTMEPADPARLIEEHQVGVWRYLRALGCDSNEAEDLTQETFLAVLRKPFEYYSRQAAAAYLRKVAYHRFISSRRGQGREVVLAELDMIDETWSKWVGQGDDNDILEMLGECLKKLPDRARWALELRFRDKMPRATIAEELSISEHGAKNLMQRAKQKLRTCIEGKLT